MELEALTCNGCGAPLEVPGDVRFVTCAHCKARLSVERGGGAIHTKVLEEIARRTDAIEEEVSQLRTHAKLERLDREWAEQREGLLTKGKDGQKTVPTEQGAVLQAVLLGLVGGGCLLIPSAMPNMASMAWVFYVMGTIVLVGTFVSWSKGRDDARRYDEALARYQDRREALCARLDDGDGDGDGDDDDDIEEHEDAGRDDDDEGADIEAVRRREDKERT